MKEDKHFHEFYTKLNEVVKSILNFQPRQENPQAKNCQKHYAMFPYKVPTLGHYY